LQDVEASYEFWNNTPVVVEVRVPGETGQLSCVIPDRFPAHDRTLFRRIAGQF
jgi:hypothetical protein